MWRLPPIRGLVTLLAGEGASRALSFLAIAILTRRFGPVAWAPVAVALTALQFGNLLVEGGMRLFGAREVARDRANASALMAPILSTQIALALVLLAAAVVTFALNLVQPDLGALLPGYALSLVALPFFVPWVFQGLGEMQWSAGPTVLRYGVFLVLAAVFVTSPERTGWLPWVECAAMASGALLATRALGRYSVPLSIVPRRAFDPHTVREAMPIAGSQFLWVVRMYLPMAVLWYLGMREAVARFDVAHRVLMVMQAGLTVYLTNLYTPLSQSARESRRRYLGLLLTSAALAGAGALVAAVVFALRAGPVLGFLNGAAFNDPEGASILAVLAFVAPLSALRGHGQYALVSLGCQRLEFLASAASCAFLAVLLWWRVPLGGPGAAAMAMLLSESLGLVLTAAALAWSMRRFGRPSSGERRSAQPDLPVT